MNEMHCSALLLISPARIYALARGALAQLLQRRGAQVAQVVGARARDDAVPDDGLVGLVRAGGGGPLGRDVDEELLGVPREQRRKVRVERELDDGVLLLLRAVVVRPALDSVFVHTIIKRQLWSACAIERGRGEREREKAWGFFCVWKVGASGWLTYTCTLVGLIIALGVRGTVKSEAAIMAPTTNATVVKKPKTFCNRVRELYILAGVGARASTVGGN